MSRKLSALLLCIFMVIAAAVSFYRLKAMTIESSVLSLLPQSTENNEQRKLQGEFIQRLNSQVIFAVGGADTEAYKDSSTVNARTDKAADRFIEELSQISYLKNITAKLSDEDKLQSAAFVYKYKAAFLSPDIKKELESDNYSIKLLSKLYSGFSGVSSAEIKNDLLLVGRALASDFSKDNSLKIENGHLTAYDAQGHKWVLVFATLNDDSMSTKVASDFTAKANKAIEKIEKEYPEVSILKKGAVFYSDYAASTSQKEITLLGSVTTIGIFCLIFFVYRSFVPVFLTIGSILCGIISALLFTTLIYDEINLIIIGMCLSVIGIVCDYTIYFTTLRIGAKESAVETIRKLTKPLSFAVITDLCAYLIILLSPVKAVSQMAFFCMCTITFACLFVILVEPLFLERLKRQKLPFEDFFKGYLTFIRQPKLRTGIIAFLCMASIFALFNLKTNDDPMSFQKMPENLKTQELSINRLIKTSENLNYLLISAGDDNTLLEKNESIREHLSKAQREGKLKEFISLKLNSEKTQADNCSFLNSRKSQIETELKARGLEIKAENYQCDLLSAEEYFSSKPGELYKNLYYRGDNYSSLMVVLENVTDAKAIQDIAASVDGCSYIDHRGSLIAVFKMYREIFMKVILIFMLCILAVSTIRVGFTKALVGTCFSALSIGTALFVLLLSGFEVNLFSELGLIVLLGIGINYNIFMSSSKLEVTSIIAIFTALATTLMTIGILVFSSVDAIKCFAICLVTGIICAFILSAFMPKSKITKDAV
ncbi:MMPL family transporter [Succinivibrio dextrinosolvens]|uniref:MMPL family transporter n=1 Tax=Succinivibrio dextrinosolvens TaxID=83771 RepID=UPI00116066E0|nr:MMPL family transporter [Succinivibrio dextrinosolvens]